MTVFWPYAALAGGPSHQRIHREEFAQPLQVEPKRKYGLGKNASQGAKTAVTERITGVWHWLARIELLFIQELLTHVYIGLEG